MKHVTIMDIPFLNTNQHSFVQLLNQRIQKKEKTFIVTANPEVVMKANHDQQFMQHLQHATYVVADGIGIVKAAKLLNQPLPERVTGYDTMIDLLKLADKNRYRIFLLGAKEGTLEKTVNEISTRYPNIEIVGSQHGYFDRESKDITASIARLQPDITFVALGCPGQESWIANNLSNFDYGIFMGVGGSFDVIAGTVKRAPMIFQKLNLEWFYRLLKQPTRWRRMLTLPQFAFRIVRQKTKGKIS
ncbi:MAG: WecB/TagA/CpsF family glycosyltransferase [Bacillota bacterium]|uniref:WecB/TagA/CpsF family glycosyltransferase n=1 Tax=unclassified Virgibacillus TaxID=2620237 RepID=UPI000EF4ED8B|nr:MULTISPECIES: WecB/TagA/CpsF family glycosyltransferase [unclassified Virgibacillus]MCC2250630.1 WecB/TagA/CpsF family glycosyltransferase [Virgibacillus sp. AGTR]MDY7045840.1 WecB/TagA/CpsF family glycosyltransferase [Virgibacillus sp. M23]QRZ18454.1 WecB/TagA/CpsF family glycosyltransferase [Virgibacillus sp. AGTR]